ncbi:hypothetical protein FRC19_003650 [Serendipita sp. 401]|nr:hypothetical protein FRC19_003650 [Serendipita sp. 401]
MDHLEPAVLQAPTNAALSLASPASNWTPRDKGKEENVGTGSSEWWRGRAYEQSDEPIPNQLRKTIRRYQIERKK